MHYLYRITCIVNNKVYIGQTKDKARRWKQHQYFAKHAEHPAAQYIHRAMAKHGVENFTFEIIDCALNHWQANCLEINYIKQYDSLATNGKGYNVEKGGNNSPASPEVIAKLKQWWMDHPEAKQAVAEQLKQWWMDHPEAKQAIAEQMRGNKYAEGSTHTDEWKQIHSEFMKEYLATHQEVHRFTSENLQGNQYALGHICSDEEKAHKSQWMKEYLATHQEVPRFTSENLQGNQHFLGHKHTEEWKKQKSEWMLDNAPMRGKTHSDESKVLIKEARAKQVMPPWTPERREKMRLANLNRKPVSPETKQRQSESAKKRIITRLPKLG